MWIAHYNHIIIFKKILCYEKCLRDWLVWYFYWLWCLNLHYPGAGVMLMVSLGGVCLLLIDHVFNGKERKMMSLNTAASLLGVLYVLAVVFKVMHLKGAGIILVVSMFGLSICLAVKAYCLRKSINAILPALFSITTFYPL